VSEDTLAVLGLANNPNCDNKIELMIKWFVRCSGDDGCGYVAVPGGRDDDDVTGHVSRWRHRFGYDRASVVNMATGRVPPVSARRKVELCSMLGFGLRLGVRLD